MYNIAKRLVIKIILKAKTSYISDRITRTCSCKQLFSITNRLFATKNKSVLPTVFPQNELPQCFLHFFHNKIQSIRNNLDKQSLLSFNDAEHCFHGRPLSSFTPVTEEIVKCTILKSNTKTCDLDPLPTDLFIECLDTLLPFITAVINDSLTTGSFPLLFKQALVKPLLKKPTLDLNDMKNYRPISNLSFLSKITERIVLSQMNDHLVSNNLFNSRQSAYRPGHSTETALLRITNDLLTSLDCGKVSVLALIDLSAAFDTIDHSVLIRRLEITFGITGTPLSWLMSYLTDRVQTVVVNGQKSAPSPLSFGVPQGSVLGPILFLLYTQPLFDLVARHSVDHHAFADDNQL